MLLIYQDILGGDIQSVCGEVTMQYRPPRQRTPQMVLDFAPVKTPNTSSTQVTGSR